MPKGTFAPINSQQAPTHGAQDGRTKGDTVGRYRGQQDPEPARNGPMAGPLKAAGMTSQSEAYVAQLEAERKAVLRSIGVFQKAVGRVGRMDEKALLERAQKRLEWIEADIEAVSADG